MLNLSSILSMSLPKGVKDFISGQSSRILDLLSQLSERDKELDKTREDLAAAEAEIRRLKKLPKRPDLKASKLDEEKPGSEKDSEEEGIKKRRYNGKKGKKDKLEIHSEEVLYLEDVPSGWELVGYRPYVLQDMLIRANNIEYQREVWRSPDGDSVLVAALPCHLQGKQFGMTLCSYVLQQYYECGSSQGIIWQSLQDFGVKISAGQINAILNENNAAFHQEKQGLLDKAIALKEELRTDDTGARHEFKNGYCNCINSDLFTYFETSFSKSRINFLSILRQDRSDYVLNQSALDYMKSEGLSPKYIDVFEVELLNSKHRSGKRIFVDKTELEAYLLQAEFVAQYATKTITEALLIGTLVEHGFSLDTLIHSDGAGQFNVFVHSLCWKHAERPLLKLRCYNEQQEQALEEKKAAFWQLYKALKKFKAKPSTNNIPILEQQFDDLCESVLHFSALNQVLEELKKKKEKLLRVLQRPETSLHNNASERDIREYVKRRKTSAGTRSENGRKARDTFLSLKKTCRKLGISFWEYLMDRLHRSNNIPMLYDIMQQRKIQMD